jgi:hypothetical protein
LQEVPVTELERARAILRLHQSGLHHIRSQGGFGRDVRIKAMSDVLAALSLVWDAQQRDMPLSRVTGDGGK